MNRISIVIPCRNEVLYIKECIAAIYANELPVDTVLNVFVVDGMSDDGTRKVVLDLEKEFPNLKLVDNVKKLTPFAFNLGIYQTQADYIQIVGARHILSSTYLSRCLQTLQQNTDIWCVGGKIENVAINQTGELISEVMSSTFGMGLGNFRTLKISGFTDTVTSPMYPYEVFEKIGFFDEDLIRNQDDDFNFRVSKAGGKIYYIHDIELKYYVRAKVSGLRKQFFQYGYWKVFVNRKHATMTTIRQLVPPAFVFYLFYLPFTLLFPCWIQVCSISPFFLYLVGMTYFTLKLVGFKFFFRTVFLFPLIHISYGTGYLLGMIDFLLLKKNPSEKQKELSR